MKLLPWVSCGILGALAFFLKFCVPGYSFSALVCLALIAVILFYTLIPMVGMKYPKLAGIAKKAVTVILILGLLIVGITECFIIEASFGDLREHVDYVVPRSGKTAPPCPSGTGSTAPMLIFLSIPTLLPLFPADRDRTSL